MAWSSSPWPPAREQRLLQLVANGRTGGEIAAELGVTRNAVLGRINRLRQAGRLPPPGPSPIATRTAQMNALADAFAAGAETPEARDARVRAQEVDRRALRLAVGPFAGTAFEGRAFWPKGWLDANGRRGISGGESGWFLPVEIFASDAAIAAQRAAAVAELDAYRAAAEAKANAPEPAIAVLDGQAWRRDAEGWYRPDGDDDEPFASWALFAAWADDEAEDLATYATVADFNAALAGTR